MKDGVVAEYSTEAINGSQLWETQQQIKDVETTANKLLYLQQKIAI